MVFGRAQRNAVQGSKFKVLCCAHDVALPSSHCISREKADLVSSDFAVVRRGRADKETWGQGDMGTGTVAQSGQNVLGMGGEDIVEGFGRGVRDRESEREDECFGDVRRHCTRAK